MNQDDSWFILYTLHRRHPPKMLQVNHRTYKNKTLVEICVKLHSIEAKVKRVDTFNWKVEIFFQVQRNFFWSWSIQIINNTICNDKTRTIFTAMTKKIKTKMWACMLGGVYLLFRFTATMRQIYIKTEIWFYLFRMWFNIHLR